MTTPSHLQSLGLSLNVWQPDTTTAGAYDPRGSYLGTLAQQITGYSHTIAAFGGFWSAQITLNLGQPEIDEWLARGLGRHLEVYGPGLMLCWEGFVNQITANLGPLAVTRGPLLSVANRVSVVYDEIQNSTDAEPSVLGRTVTTIIDDAASQARYGILERVETGGQLTAANAVQLQNVILTDCAWPATSKSLSTGGGSALSLTIDLLGYVNWLGVFQYIDTTAGFSDIATKIAAVLDADPNGLFDSTNASIAANALLAPTAEYEQAVGLDVIKSLVALGGTAYGRTLFGVYESRRAAYEAAPTTDIAYHQRLSDPGVKVVTPAGSEVYPWDVRPGQWCFFPDLLIGRTVPTTDLRTDPRMLFIEQVAYRAPYGLDLSGSKVETLPQVLATYALDGAA